MHSNTEHFDIEKELNKISSNLKQELIASGAIDAKSLEATNTKLFDEVLDKKIKQCYSVLAKTENEAGVTIDRNGANKVYALLQHLEDMKKFKSLLSLEAYSFQSDEDKLIQPKKSESMKKGIGKLLQKMQQKFVPTVNREK